MGAALQTGYLFTFSLQDYIGIIIVFNGAFFWWLALFEGPVDLGRWRKMDPFWGIRLLRKKMQLHTGPFFFSPLCFPLGANLWGCSILEPEWCWSKHNSVNTLGFFFFFFFPPAISLGKDESKRHSEFGHYDLCNEIHVTDRIVIALLNVVAFFFI